jgi:hypothetical protein
MKIVAYTRVRIGRELIKEILLLLGISLELTFCSLRRIVTVW